MSDLWAGVLSLAGVVLGASVARMCGGGLTNAEWRLLRPPTIVSTAPPTPVEVNAAK